MTEVYSKRDDGTPARFGDTVRVDGQGQIHFDPRPHKYSYMLHRSSKPHEPIYFESDKKTLQFRNQYGEKYIFGPIKGMRITCFVFLIAGIIIGAVLL